MDFVFFYRYKGSQCSKCPLQPVPSVLPIRMLTRSTLLLPLFRTMRTYLRLAHLTPLFSPRDRQAAANRFELRDEAAVASEPSRRSHQERAARKKLVEAHP